MFLIEKKAPFLLFYEGYLTPRGWALELAVDNLVELFHNDGLF
ncbi:hypothetical protein ACQCVP_22055 [Rossellomorea vietnamensis]